MEKDVNKDGYVHLYSGSEVRVILLKGLLEDKGIQTMVQNEFQSGVFAGFPGGTGTTIRLKIHPSDLENAQSILEDFIQNQQ
ncbi:DUF2007 domain-containing protein [Robiginitalea sp.]|uniref:putative signal transducing protein n=1 Tax=Robiginitalea sp. TaxID=1902411 RepID=UPI003C658E43